MGAQGVGPEGLGHTTQATYDAVDGRDAHGHHNAELGQVTEAEYANVVSAYQRDHRENGAAAQRGADQVTGDKNYSLFKSGTDPGHAARAQNLMEAVVNKKTFAQFSQTQPR